MTVNLRKTFAIAAAASTLALVSGCSDDSSSAADSTTVATAAESAAADGSSSDEPFKAGTYTADGSYTNPGGTSEVEVTLTVDDAGTISAVEVTPLAKGGNSLQFQTQFAEGVSDEVVGKSIDDLDVGKVSGSSLTHNGFDAAVEKIRAEATA